MDGKVNIAARGESPGRALSAWGQPRARAERMLSASRLVVMLAVLAIGTTLLCAAIGYSLARQSDERLCAEHRASLRHVIAESRVLFDKGGAIDPRFVHMVEQTSGLKGLKFEIDPAAGLREMQPVMNTKGRIAGFFTCDETSRWRRP